jgi:hypothetical protein
MTAEAQPAVGAVQPPGATAADADGRSRYALLGGAVAVLLLVGAVVVIGSGPESTAAGEEVARTYAGEEVTQALAAFALVAAAPFLLVFALALAGIGATGVRPSLWERLTVAGGAVVATLLLVAGWIHLALVDVADDAAPEALQALNAADATLWLPFNAALGILLLGAAGTLLGRRLLPSWIGWVAVVLGVALFFPYAGFFALLVTLLWIPLVGVLLFTRLRRG